MTETADPIERAQADVDYCRELVDATRRRVAAHEDGASSLHAADYRLSMARKRLARLTADEEAG